MNMRTVAVAIPAALLAVLTLVSAAGAACAWVLWEQQTLIASSGVAEGTQWSPIGGYVGAAECAKDLPGDSRRTTTQALELLKQYRCLPDTVDPRGPKGGGR